MSDDPFALLGLAAGAGLSDDDVRAAWRRVAAATHPDREDGGDPARFGAAAAAYVRLRTANGRGEALADLDAGGADGPGRQSRWIGGASRHGDASRVGDGSRIGALAMRCAAAASVAALAFIVAGWAPSSIGVTAGALTWLFAAARRAT